MKRFIQRSTSLILLMVMLISLFSGLTVSAASYTYNNGKKGTLCTALSSSAKSYYGTGYDYATLSKLSGTALEAKLRERMVSGWHGASYDNLKTTFKYTDAYNGSSSSVYCFYSNTSVTSWNREHVWPQSKGSFTTESNSAGSDVLHLRPTDNKANSTRSNLPYGEVTGGTYQTVYTSAGKVAGYYSPAFYEPLDSVKGDVARTLLYVYTRWEERNLTDVIASTDLLLKWCEEDPVDEYEMKRNDICQEICGSRNIYVDYPEYCWRVFGKTIPTHMKTPSGSGNTCNNPQYEAKITTAATCTGNGVTTYTCKNCGYSYTEVIPSQGHHYVNGSCTVCGAKQAAIQYFFTDTLANGDEVVIFNPARKMVMTTTASTYTNSSTGVTYDQIKGTSASVAGTELTCSGSSIAVFTVVKSGSNYAFKLSDGRYLTCETSQYLTLDSTPKTGTNYWALEDSGTDNCWYVKNTTTYYQDYQKNYAYLEYYGSAFTTFGFKGTAGESAYAMQFYKVTRAASCEHTYQVTATKAATCTDQGYTSYQCSKCGDAYTTYTAALGHDFVEGVCTRCGALDPDHNPGHTHSYTDEVIAPTCTKNGYTVHTCTVCGESYKDSEVPALGHNFVNGVCTRCGALDPNASEHDCPCDDYNDLSSEQWYHAGVDYALQNGLMNGVGGGRFDPNGSLTRAMLVTILYRSENTPDVSGESNPFTDVPEGQWYTDAVIWAAKEKIVNGMSETTFAPNESITREQIATILYRYAGSPQVSGNLYQFSDAFSVSTYAYDAMLWAVKESIITGMNGKLAPKDNATRAQIATILYRYLNQ